MAKKPKTPPPPRPVQAPKTRSGGGAPRADRKRLYAVAGAGIVALAVVVAVLAATGGGGSKNVSALMKAAGCTVRTVDGFIPKGEGNHVNSLTKKFAWNTFPPSNGQHYPAWAVWGFYTKPVNPRMVVHNEEHGGVVLWWGPQTPEATVQQLNDLYNADAAGIVGTPIEGLGGKVAITVWTGDPARYMRTGYYGQGHVGVCPVYDAKVEKAFQAFRDAYRAKGPEGVPLSQDQPGTGPG